MLLYTAVSLCLAANAYAATLDPRSIHRFKVCKECRDRSPVLYKRRFPHPVSLHEPAGRNQLAAQCTSLARSMLAVALYIAACGNPLTDDTSSTTDEVFATDFLRPRGAPLRIVRICKACRYSSERNKHLFPWIVA